MPGVTLSNHGTSAAQLLDAAKCTCIVPQQVTSAAASEHVTSSNPYALFLCILCQELRKAEKQGSTNPLWRSFKGRSDSSHNL